MAAAGVRNEEIVIIYSTILNKYLCEKTTKFEAKTLFIFNSELNVGPAKYKYEMTGQDM